MKRAGLYKAILWAFIASVACPSWSAQSYRVNNGTDQDIDEHGNCSNVDNASGRDLFVPTNTSGEWAAFRNNAPAGVTVSPCSVAITGVLEPPDSEYGEGSYIDFQVSWAQNVTVGGVPRIVLNIGGSTKYAIYVDGSGTQHLTFRYIVQAGDTDSDGIAVSNTTIDLNGGSLSGPGSTDMSGHIGSLAGVQVDTSITPPDQVIDVTLAPTANSTTMGVSWGVPNDNGNAITYYIVQYREQGDTLWINHSPNPTANSTEVTGLSSSVTYELRVAAFNGALGTYSAVSTAEIFNVLDYSPITWLDATDPAGDGSQPANGTKIATWVNKAGTGTNATEGTAANQPTFTTNAQNGLPAIRFVNHDRGLQGTFTRANGTALTIIAVVQFESSVSDRCVFEFKGPGNERGFFIDRRYATNTLFSPAATKDQFNIYTITDTGGSATVVENTTTIHSGAVDFNTDFTGNGNYVLGDDTSGGNRMTGYIGEFLIFDEQLNATNINKIKAYLKAKWGTP